MSRLTILALAAAVSAAAQVRIEKTAYKGWPNCWRVANGTVELIVTGDVGPRIMRYAFAGGGNIFKEYDEQLGKSGEKEYQLRGGHRLWVAPEQLATTWALDNGPVKISVTGDTLEATHSTDSAGLEKSIRVRLADGGTAVELVHRITNKTPWEIEFAPWALTMMAPGGRALTGFPPRGTHPEDLLPTNPLVMWAYTDLSDPRWGFTKKYLTLRQDPRRSAPQKIGLFHERTWAGYLLDGELFLKQTEADAEAVYPDFGCSFEMFTNGEMLEIETLGPTERVPSGETVEHVERWSLHRGVSVTRWTDAELDRLLEPLLE